MPGLVKIGCTDRTIEERMRELSAASGVPVPFECFLAIEVPNPMQVERALHYAFGDKRVNAKREFFELSADRPAAILEIFRQQNPSARDVTPSTDIVDDPAEQTALDRERVRRSNFRFSQVGIIPGTTLISSFNPQVTCEVIDDRRILFRNVITSLSEAALSIARETGRNWKAVQGPQFWTYDGKSLAEMREEAETA